MNRKNDRSSDGGPKTDGRRVSRVEKEVQSVISNYIIKNLQGELPGLVTIGKVQIPADLRQARVYVSIFDINDPNPSPEKLEHVVDTLQSWSKEIQDEISHQLKMKYLPKVTFFPDESTNKILKIERILSNIKAEGPLLAEDEDDEDFDDEDDV